MLFLLLLALFAAAAFVAAARREAAGLKGKSVGREAPVSFLSELEGAGGGR